MKARQTIINLGNNLADQISRWCSQAAPVPERFKDVLRFNPNPYCMTETSFGESYVTDAADDAAAPRYKATLVVEQYNSSTRADFPHWDIDIKLERVLPGKSGEFVISAHRINQIQTRDEKTKQNFISDWNSDSFFVKAKLNGALPSLALNTWRPALQVPSDPTTTVNYDVYTT